jgi:glycosyltransferase involved in cell wall biosynthesis
MQSKPRRMVWWGRFDPEYSRNRIVRQCLAELGWRIIDFHPRLSFCGDLEARWKIAGRPELVWVPCFRQRDIAAASRWARRLGIPLLVDPLISAYDKQIFEREKYPPASRAAQRLLAWERDLLQRADLVLADTPGHADYFHDMLGVRRERLHVVPIGAEETLFVAKPKPPGTPLEIFFYGSFIALQGPQTIIEAAKCYQGPAVRWHLAGAGPLLDHCRTLAAGHPDIVFENWIPYPELPARIHRADLMLGIFGATAKASRVIPNKVYQALACGRPVVTLASAAYPAELREQRDCGILWVPPADPAALAQAVAHCAERKVQLPELGTQARVTYERYFSMVSVRNALSQALAYVAQKDKQAHP